MRRDRRPFVMLHDGYPEHPKVMGLSDKAFRVHVTLICWARRQNTDGHIPDAVLLALAKPKVIAELVTFRLLDQTETGNFLHDYLEHQPSSQERSGLSQEREEAGRRGAHTRHHLRKGVYSDDCTFCVEDGEAASKPGSKPLASANGFRSKPLAEVEVEKKEQESASHSLREGIALATTVDESFDRFWAAYPRKTAKANARKAWPKACKALEPERLVKAAQYWAGLWRETGTHEQFIPHPATWLNGQRWDDQPPAQRAAVSGGHVPFQSPDPSRYHEEW